MQQLKLLKYRCAATKIAKILIFFWGGGGAEARGEEALGLDRGGEAPGVPGPGLGPAPDPGDGVREDPRAQGEVTTKLAILVPARTCIFRKNAGVQQLKLLKYRGAATKITKIQVCSN